MKQYRVRAMADIVINHRTGTTQGHGGSYNRFDGIPLAWDERAVTSCTGGLVRKVIYVLIYIFVLDIDSKVLLLLLYFREIEALELFFKDFLTLTILRTL